MSAFKFISSEVANRGHAPDAFLQELLAWGKTEHDEVFMPRTPPASGKDYDIYAWIRPALGPWQNTQHRRAVMLEVLRVLAGFESSWNWNEGRDMSAGPEKPEEMEAGAWQVSYNSIELGQDLRDLCVSLGIHSADQFQVATKANHTFAMEYAARLLRHTVKANGPALRHEIDQYLGRHAISEWLALLQDTRVPQGS